MTGVRRVGLLAPMDPELRPLVRQLGLVRDGDVHRGDASGIAVVAMLTTIGMAAGAQAAERILEHDVDWVMVVGVAGGVDHTIEIGSVIVPENVLERATGRTFQPSFVGDIEPRGTLSCGDDLITDPGAIAEMERDGVVAVDMETAAVAAVCTVAGAPWSVFRGISDFADGGLVDDALFAITNPDGSADPDAIARYLEADPARARVLEQLGHDFNLASEGAAAATVRACAALAS